MRPNAVRDLVAGGGTAVNAWLSVDSPYVAEVLSHAGFDAVTVDLQHGMFGIDTAVRLLQAVSAGPAMPVARCASHDPAEIGKLLDAGAYAIICPSVDTAAQARAFVDACRYPPTGSRSYGPARGVLYGGADYVPAADGVISTWAMIESATALANVADIVATPGLDAVFVGPNDLALSLGERPGSTVPPPPVAAALRHVLAVAHAAGLLAGVFCADGERARELADAGWDLVTPGNDIAMLRTAAAGHIAAVRAGGSAPTAGAGGAAGRS